MQAKKPTLSVRCITEKTILVSFLTNTMADPDETLEMEKRGFLHFTSSSGLTLSQSFRVWVVEFKVQDKNK